MKKFDLKKMIAENKATFFSSLNEDASNTAEKFAQYMSKKEGKTFTVTPGSVDEKSFDLDVDGMEYEGGSYLIKDNGDIVNVAITPNEVYGNVNQLEKAKELSPANKVDMYANSIIKNYMQGGTVKDIQSVIKKEGLKGPELAKWIMDDMEIIELEFGEGAIVSQENSNTWTYESDKVKDAAMKKAAKMIVANIDSYINLEEGKAAYEYEKGKKAGEAIEKKKMKKSELKAKIKEMIVAEMDGPAVEDEQYDFLKEIEEMLNEAEGLTPLQDYVYQYEIEISGEDSAQDFLDDIRKLNTPQDVYDYYAYERDFQDHDVDNIFRQVKRKFKNLSEADEDTADAEAVADAGAEEEVDVTTDTTVSEVDPNVEAVQDALTQAQAAAQKLGDAKLMDQIGNTITFFTRAHVVEKPAGAVSEGEEMKEGYFGANNEVEELIDALEYETMDEFFNDNPGVITVILDWAAGVPEFRTKMIANGLLESKKENMNESMFPMLKKIIK
jgi:hypothetical protein